MRWPIVALAMLIATNLANPCLAQVEVARVTLMVGAPRMIGESIRPLQAIMSGRLLETGEGDAAGLLEIGRAHV